MSLKVQNQSKFKNHPLIIEKNDFRNYTEENKEVNAGDVIEGIFNRVNQYVDQGQAIHDTLAGDANLNIGEDVTITPGYDQPQSKILGIPKPLFYAGVITITVATGVIVISLVAGKKNKQKLN